MTDEPWYELCSGDSLMQGDILFGCEIYVPDVSAEPGETNVAAIAHEVDLVVITQSCDLENEGKVDDVILVELHDYAELSVEPGYGKDFRAKCVAGRIPAFLILRPYSGDPALNWSLVDFRRVHSLPLPLVREYAARADKRLRLRSPYREHLAQGFARYFMRVGLPTGVDDFKAHQPQLA